MFEYIGHVLRAPLNFAKNLLKSPLSTLFYGLFSKWFIMAASLMVIVVYFVLNGLNEIGFFTGAARAFNKAAKEIKAVAQHCTPLIGKPKELFECLNNTPEYTPDENVRKFESMMNKEIEESYEKPVNERRMDMLSPYDKIVLKKKEGQ